MHRPRPLASLVLHAALGLIVGCGVYSASSGRVDESLKRVAVEYLENRTAEADLGVTVAEGIIDAIQEDNTLKVVSTDAADSILDGAVTGYRLRRMAVSAELQVEEYQVQMVVELTLRVKATGEAIFEKRRFTGTGNYYLNDPNGSSELTAREAAIVEIVRDVLAQVVEDW
ncbi:MAG: LPS assembly lipoprotein LptE [Candidatus Krumholzibacteriia bacterium]